jgi:uncharacterized Fe-S cluster-containing radical SAM superfamily protein
MAYQGCLGHVARDFLFGWAYDDSCPNQRIEVELYHFSDGVPKVLGSIIADQFRADLLNRGYGDGSYGFRFLIPSQFRDETEHAIHARIKDNQQELTNSPVWIRQEEEFSSIQGDIVNNCNLRCPFCVVDYSKVAGLKLMSEETLRKALELAPMTRDGHFWFSCLHEPTLHPRFVDLIEIVPENLRKKVSFTTNLCNKLSDDTLERLANSNIHNIRVSFDSTNPEVFAKLRQNGRYEVFSHNLERFVKFLKASDRRPLLRFITMAFKDNLNEIPDLVRRCHEEYEADFHEVRLTYYMPHLVNWIDNHLLTKGEWIELEQKMAHFPASYNFVLCGPPEGYYERFEAEREGAVYVPLEAPFGGPYPVQPTVIETAPPRLEQEQALNLRMRWDGAIVARDLSEGELVIKDIPEELFRVDVNQLQSPATFFKKIQGFVQIQEPDHAKLKRSQAQLQQVKTQLEQLQAELVASRALVEAMQSSKFWQLRDRWIQVKKIFSA